MTIESNFRLTGAQINFFNLFGYLVLPGLFSAQEMAAIAREFEKTFEQGGKDESWPSLFLKVLYFSV